VSAVVELAALPSGAAARIAAAYGAELVVLKRAQAIPGSYWGAPEAGLVGRRVYVRPDTPAHSFLHELSHFVCMDPARRSGLTTDAGGDDDEECAVCFLQIALAAWLPGFGRERVLADMDAWGYSFREGSARAWLAGDARHAREWLRARALIDADDAPTWALRGA
jgi:hypothetical protein